MRIGTCILIIVCSILTLGAGCEPEVKEISENGIYDVVFVEYPDPPCGERIRVEFKDMTDERSYYRVALIHNDTFYKVSDPSIFQHPMREPILFCSIDVTADDQLPPGYYSLVVVRLTTDSLVPGISYYKVCTSHQIADRLVQIPDYTAEGCGDNVACTQGRKYAYMGKPLANVVGCRAAIRFTFGNLCGGGTNPQAAMSAVYAGVGKSCPGSGDNGFCWAQAGACFERFDGIPAAMKASYVEIQGNTYQVYYDYVNPEPGYVDRYECELNPSTGIWVFYHDNVFMFPDSVYSDYSWIGNGGDQVVWGAEIYNFEDDMVGTVTDTCVIYDCCMKIEGGAWCSVPLGATDEPHSDDDSEWRIEKRSPDSLNVWDVHPR